MRGHFSALLRDVACGTAQVALRIVLLAHSAWLMGDAIVRTLYRLFVSRRHLLEWRTASQAQKVGDDTLVGYYRTDVRRGGHRAGRARHPARRRLRPAPASRLIFALFWAGSPAFAWLVSRSAETEDRLIVAEADKVKLRAIGRRTWLYFETFVTAEHNMLPPDNFQETPDAGGRRPHLADQYRHLPSVGHLGARLRLDQPRGGRPSGSKRRSPPSRSWIPIAAISTTGTTRGR